MNRTIEYYYGIYIEDDLSKDKIIKFNYLNEEYYFVIYDRNVKDINQIVDCSEELINRGFYCHQIIRNRFNQVLSMVDNRYYILLKIIANPSYKVDLFELLRFNSYLTVNKITLKNFNDNWGNLWQEKVDYMENQIRFLGKGKIGVINSFSYYVGLAENAISYYWQTKRTVPDDSVVCLSHRRIFFPNIWLNYGNPLSFLFDLQVRDIAEYLKFSFFYHDTKETYYDLDVILKSKKMSKYSYQLLFARLLFPTYYFDVCEDILTQGSKEIDLSKIIDKSTEYEKFLKYCYYNIVKREIISEVPRWIINQR